MFKKILAAVMCLCMLLCIAGCKPNEEFISSDYQQIGSQPQPTGEFVVNPLTGIKDLDSSVKDNRPVAVMVNNVKVAWDVQKGLSQADIVYETYVEGGITRLMAVYKDISKAGDIGTVRSARYAYVDLAAGHDAIYVHCGLDPNYCKPHIAEIKMDDFDINTGKDAKYGFRVKNGKASEHTMYTSGAKLAEGISKLGYDNNTSVGWAKFAAEGTTVAMTGACDKLTVPMNGSTFTSTFTYNAETKKYLKTQGGSAHKDYGANEQIAVSNVLVLFTNVSNYAIKKYAKIDLTGGKGYYISNGQYKEINWKKGNTASSPMTFTNTDGTELELNAGNSWIFITKNSVQSSVKIEAATPETSSVAQ